MKKNTTVFRFLSTFTDHTPEELVIPADFSGLDHAQVQELYASTLAEFDAKHADFAATMSAEQVKTLGQLTDGIEALAAELSRRDAEIAERAEAAEALASRVQALRAENAEPAAETVDEPEGETIEIVEETVVEEAEPLVASAKRSEIRVAMSGVRRQTPAAPALAEPAPVAFSTGEGTGFRPGEAMTIDTIAKAIDRKLMGFNGANFASAKQGGRQLREQHSIVQFSRNFSRDLIIDSTDQEHVDSVMSRAVDQTRLQGGGLLASGGWCAPSETMYDLLELETLSGMLSLPEVQVSRGGIRYSTGPDFASLFAEITGFNFSEQDDVDGKYQPGVGGNVVGPKPCYHVECADFAEDRLEVAGLCITAGLLQQRGYPELIARTVRGALVAHAHRVNALKLQSMIDGSTAVNMGSQVGTAAPILDAVEKQVEHYRATHRLSPQTVLEAVFPMWTRGAFRSDLSRRLGIAEFDVSDERIAAWFRQRGVNPQYVYSLQDLAPLSAATFVAWPNELNFLLYAAGTWVSGVSPVITLDTVYDSQLLAQNDYTALFTEEGFLTSKRGHDSRIVRVGIEADGATHVGVQINHNGTIGV